MAGITDIGFLTRPVRGDAGGDLVGERGQTLGEGYKKPEKDHFFKWLGQTNLAQGAKDNIVDFFSQKGQLESDWAKTGWGSWADIMKTLRIDEEDSSGKLLKTCKLWKIGEKKVGRLYKLILHLVKSYYKK